MPLSTWLKEALRSGTIASLVMMPPGLAFQAVGLRVGHYGPKFAGLWVDNPTPAFLFAQHLVLGWVSALPLLAWLAWSGRAAQRPVVAGALYGAAYYAVVNSLGLPWWFGDPTPWQLGPATVLPSLVVHTVYGASIGFTAAHFGFAARAARQPTA
ncbi:MAG: hypothetical protein WBK26_15755 [Burkholderiaceae bacterium]